MKFDDDNDDDDDVANAGPWSNFNAKGKNYLYI